MAFVEDKTRPIGFSITGKMALLSWLLALATLLTFVAVTIPQQKRTFLNNLQSKANSVAVSLHDVAAGAAINDDLASVVSAAQTLLEGDPDLNFLVITRNDGFSLINQASGWRVEPEIDDYWRPQERKPSGKIATPVLFDEQIYHFAQPFDYSGIQWGWIHVGLSLDGYNDSVNTLYRNTVLIALACILFSLIAALYFAGRLVRPIQRLRRVVEQIAGGDLSVRADNFSRDELGSLAASVNTMTESLLRRDAILESVRDAAQQFLYSDHWEESIDKVLVNIGQAADADRAYLFVNHPGDMGDIHCSLRYEWTDKDISVQLSNPDLQNMCYRQAGFEEWTSVLGRKDIIVAKVAEMSEPARSILEAQQIISIVVIPVFVDDVWWGFLGLDECTRERVWSDAEQDSLHTVANMLGATIARQHAQQAVLEAKATLEQRVEERTLELLEQVTAKEQALAQLAEAQESLVEASRSAGMAEVATGVLHNVGNVLNSVNVSSNLLVETLRQSRIANLAKVAELMNLPEKDLAGFISEDPRGKQIPAYLRSLAAALKDEQHGMITEVESLHSRIEHIKEIVTMQQTYGRLAGVLESFKPDKLMEDALALNSSALNRHGVKVVRRYQDASNITVDKHKVLQILLNLINNAKYACSEGTGEKTITLDIFHAGPDRIVFQVSDTGIGIPAENLTRIFQHGFTTRQSGHGFGLHSGALAAKEMGGSLNAHSDGPGMGATFTLELPIIPEPEKEKS
ncbi:MAG: ATP-binding protein [Pelovirga sp.]